MRRIRLFLAFTASLCFVTGTLALDMVPPYLQRANELGAAALAAAQAMDGNPIEGLTITDDGTYRVWSKTCSVSVAITSVSNEAALLSAPTLHAELRSKRCNGENR